MESKKKILVESAEFRVSDGHHVVWSDSGEGYTLHKHACSPRYVKTKRPPTLVNILWLTKNYPCKLLKSQ